MKKARFNGSIYAIILDYDAISVDYIVDVDNYLTKRNDIV